MQAMKGIDKIVIAKFKVSGREVVIYYAGDLVVAFYFLHDQGSPVMGKEELKVYHAYDEENLIGLKEACTFFDITQFCKENEVIPTVEELEELRKPKLEIV